MWRKKNVRLDARLRSEMPSSEIIERGLWVALSIRAWSYVNPAKGQSIENKRVQVV